MSYDVARVITHHLVYKIWFLFGNSSIFVAIFSWIFYFGKVSNNDFVMKYFLVIKLIIIETYFLFVFQLLLSMDEMDKLPLVGTLKQFGQVITSRKPLKSDVEPSQPSNTNIDVWSRGAEQRTVIGGDAKICLTVCGFQVRLSVI